MQETTEPGRGAAGDARPLDEACMSHAMLLGRVTRGDRLAFEELFDRFVAPVHGLVLAVVDDADRAAEVVALLFADLWRSPSEALSTPGSGPPVGVQSRILAAAHRRAVQSVRRRREDSEVGDAPDQRVPGPAARVLSRIPDADAVTAIELAYFRGRTIGEIATTMGVPLSRVASLLSGGLKELRRRPGAG